MIKDNKLQMGGKINSTIRFEEPLPSQIRIRILTFNLYKYANTPILYIM